MRNAQPPEARVPVEFIGRARQLRRDVAASAQRSQGALPLILAPLREQLMHRPTMRAETIAGAMRAWRLAPSPLHRLTFAIRMRDGTAHIDELFLVETTMNRPDWGAEREPGICLSAFSIRLSRRKLDMSERDLAVFSLHAIARRIERGTCAAERTDAAVMRDLAAVAALRPQSAAEGRLVMPAGSGYWAGNQVAIGGKSVAMVRTWLDRDMGRRL